MDTIHLYKQMFSHYNQIQIDIAGSDHCCSLIDLFTCITDLITYLNVHCLPCNRLRINLRLL